MVRRKIEQNFTYLSAILLAFAFLILLITLYPYRPQSFSSVLPTPTPIPNLAPVIINQPDLKSSITSPMLLSGKIDRFWVFEATFPLQLFDDQGQSLYFGTGFAPDWTEGQSRYVDFTASLEFSTQKTRGILEIRNDNPSGLKSNSKSIKFPVSFSHE